MLSEEIIENFETDLSPAMELQEKLLAIKEDDIESIKDFIIEQFTDKLQLRRVLSILSSFIYARPLNLQFYCQILSSISSKIKPLFDSHEVSSLFDNKSALLTLLQSKLITQDSIIQKFKGRQFDINFFYPEIETAKKPKNIKTLLNDEYRFNGQNEDNVATFIRNDDVQSLSKAMRFDETLLNSNIRSSRYETFDFVKSFGKKPSLIEYAAFFGSVNVFKYLLESGAVIGEILPEFAVAGGNIEIIHLLEENKYLSFGDECLQASVEFFQYELIEYFMSTNNLKHSVYNLFESIKHFNYEIFIELIQNSEFTNVDILNQCIFYSIEFQNVDALNLVLKFDNVDDVKNENGIFFLILNNTPLIIAASYGYFDIFNVLFNDKNININLCNSEGIFFFFDFNRNALHVAAMNGYFKIVKILLNRNDIEYMKADNYGIFT